MTHDTSKRLGTALAAAILFVALTGLAVAEEASDAVAAQETEAALAGQEAALAPQAGTADAAATQTPPEAPVPSGEAAKPTSGELIVQSWAAHGKKDVAETFRVTQKLIDLYSAEADRQQASLTVMPKNRPDIETVQSLNDVATAYFIRGESLRDQKKDQEAIDAFKVVTGRYAFAQAWDPRGWFWSVAKAAQESIDKLQGRTPVVVEEVRCKVSTLATTIKLYDPGKEDFVDYAAYGEFQNRGTKDYRFVVKDQEGLSAAVGEGIYPNTTSIRWDPAYKKAQKEKRLECSHWDFVHSPDLEAAFLKWATCPEPQGVRLFYTGLILEKAGLLKHALKCYYAVIVHFPGAYGWTYWHTPWYVGQAALAKIHHILRNNPSLGYRLEGADVVIVNGFDNDIANDAVIADPGRWRKISFLDRFKARLPRRSSRLKRQVGGGAVHLVQYENEDWQLMVEGKPYTIKGITYAPTKVGQSPDNGTLGNWMDEDFNGNGKADGPFDAFVDKNGNNRQDTDEPAVGDFKLMQEMGVNTIRLYHHPARVNKEVLRRLFADYGIRVVMGDFLGKYALGSGAPWNPGTDYKNETHQKNMLESVRSMVMEFKDEPYLLFWLLGNENVYGYACNADKEPEAFFSFANEAARLIKSLDPDHPVAICSGDILFLDRFGKYSADIDMFGTNAYRGDYGFGSLWKQVKEQSGKPVFITEFGCPAYAQGKSAKEAEALQAAYHRGSWQNIDDNKAFSAGAGNALGGFVFEWLDEWWKAYEPAVHDHKALWAGPFPDGYMHEEWLGMAGQGDGSQSPFLRHLREAYYTYRHLWK